MMKKNFLPVCLAVTLLLMFSGCEEDTPPRVMITISGLPAASNAVWPATGGKGANTYFSLSVFKPGTDIVGNSSSMTKLGGAIQQGVTMGSLGGSLTFVFPLFASGDYVLVLGVSNDLNDASKASPQGKMYITGDKTAETGGTDIKVAVPVNFSSPIPFSQHFLINQNGGGASNGYTAVEIIANF